jgi:hypothetical protein
MRVLIDGHDSEGNLVLADGQLAAVIVRLDGEHRDPGHEGCGISKLVPASATLVTRPCSRRPMQPEPGLNKP